MCYQFTSYQLKKSCELSSKQIWTSQIKENVVVRDSILEIDLKINSGNWSLVVIQKLFLLKNELVRKVIVTTSGKDSTRRITRHASLDYNVNENEILKTMLLWFCCLCIWLNICEYLCDIFIFHYALCVKLSCNFIVFYV